MTQVFHYCPARVCAHDVGTVDMSGLENLEVGPQKKYLGLNS